MRPSQKQMLIAQREMYVRICACLVNAMKSGGCAQSEDGDFLIPREDYDAVPRKFMVDVTPVQAQSEDDEGPRQMFQIRVRDKPLVEQVNGLAR